MSSTEPSATSNWQVICLCAQWCGTCRDWRPMFEQAAASNPGVRFAWVDTEDEADAMGEVDIETFPTLLIAQGSKARFLGPVLPSVQQVSRLLASLQADERAGSPPTEAPALLARLQSAGLAGA